MKLLNKSTVERCISMREAIDCQKKAFIACLPNNGNISTQPSRVFLDVPEVKGVTLFKPALYYSCDAFSGNQQNKEEDRTKGVVACKIVSSRPENTECSTITGVVILLDKDDGEALCVMDSDYLTGIRTSAGSGAATEVLAIEDAENLVVFGAGLQAKLHVEAMLCARPSISNVYIINRNQSHGQKLVETYRIKYPNVNIEDCISKSEVDKFYTVLGLADIICTTTGSKEALFDTSKFTPKKHLHVNSVGSFNESMKEIPADLIENITSQIYLDSSEALKAGEFQQLDEKILKVVKDEHTLIGSTFLDTFSKDENIARNERITWFKSVGIALQDTVTAQFVYEKSLNLQLGTAFDQHS